MGEARRRSVTQRPFRTFQLRRRRAAPPRRRLHDHMRVYASREMTRSRRWRLHETTLDAVDVAARESTRLVWDAVVRHRLDGAALRSAEIAGHARTTKEGQSFWKERQGLGDGLRL